MLLLSSIFYRRKFSTSIEEKEKIQGSTGWFHSFKISDSASRWIFHSAIFYITDGTSGRIFHSAVFYISYCTAWRVFYPAVFIVANSTAGGILYPPGALNSQITDYELALKLAPKNDDLWFKAMALLNNTTIRLSENPSKVFIPIPGTQKISLKKINVVKNFNVDQWNDLTEYFKLDLNKN